MTTISTVETLAPKWANLITLLGNKLHNDNILINSDDLFLPGDVPKINIEKAKVYTPELEQMVLRFLYTVDIEEHDPDAFYKQLRLQLADLAKTALWVGVPMPDLSLLDSMWNECTTDERDKLMRYYFLFKTVYQ